MQELMDASVAVVNLPYTVLLVVVLLYWATVIVGAIDLGSLDIDLSVDVDADGSVGWLESVLAFFNVGEVPVAIIVSIASVCMWTFSMLGNHYLGNDSWLVALAIFIPNTVVSLTLAKLFSAPLRAIFKKLDEDTVDRVSVIGNLCKVRSGTVTDSCGQAELSLDKAHLVINVRTSGDESLHHGDEAVIVEYRQEQDCYIVTSLEMKE